MQVFKICVSLLALSIHVHAFDYTSLPNPMVKKGQMRCLHSRVTFLEDGDGNCYVLKEYPKTTRKPLLTSTVCEILATEMAHAVGVRHDRVCLIPAGVVFIGKTTNLPVSLHTFVHGIPYKYCKNNYYSDICLLQEKKRGLTREVVYHMSRHRDLPALVALDTFVGNNDRGRTNYFYDSNGDRFIGIDLGCAFNKHLCTPSCKNIEALASDPLIDLHIEEWQALEEYTATLQQLITLYPPEISCALLDQYAEQAGFYNDIYFDKRAQAKWKEFFVRNKKVIQDNYGSSLKLLQALKLLLNRNRSQGIGL